MNKVPLLISAALLMVIGCGAQTLQTGLQLSTGITWKQNLFVAGLREHNGSLKLLCERFSEAGMLADSASLEIGSGRLTDFLRLSCDTLHGSLNVYLQKKGQRSLRIVRFNNKPSVTADINDVEPARLNNLAMLGADPYYFHSRVYAVKTSTDTSGVQYFLNCYTLKDPSRNFDYLFTWQFAFERRNVSKARVIYADRNRVFLFADVENGPKKGQWVLCVNAGNGQLIRGSRISAKGEEAVYSYGICRGDSLNNDLAIMGEKTSGPAAAKKSLQIFYVSVDSLGEIPERQVFNIPVNEPPRGNTKTPPTFRIGFERLQKSPLGITVETDLYVSAPQGSCHNYCNSLLLQIVPGDNGWTLEKTEARSNKTVEEWLLLNDKLRINGQLCRDSADQRSSRHAALSFPVKMAYRKENGAGIWLLQRTETSKGNIGFGKTTVEKGKLVIQSLGEIPKTLAPRILPLPGNRFALLSDDVNGGLSVQQGAW